MMMAMTGDEPLAGNAAPPASDGEPSPFATLDPLPDPPSHAEEKAEGSPTVPSTQALRLDLVLDIPVRLSVELGRTEIPIRDVVNLGRGSMIELDRSAGEPLDVRVNGVLIGRGEVVVINEERLGLRFTEVVSQAERIRRLS